MAPKNHRKGLSEFKRRIWDRSIILQQPEDFGIREAKGGDWRFLRVEFRIWPGQGSLIENTFKQTVIALMKNLYPDYAEWMVTVTYRVE